MEAYVALHAYALRGKAMKGNLKGATLTRIFPVTIPDGQIAVESSLMVAVTHDELVLRATMEWSDSGTKHQSLGLVRLNEESAARLAVLAHDDIVAARLRAVKADDRDLYDWQFDTEGLTTPREVLLIMHQYYVIQGAKDQEPDMLCLLSVAGGAPHVHPHDLVRIWEWVQAAQ